MNIQLNAPAVSPLTGRELAAFGAARLRDELFEAVYKLWRRRNAAGMTKRQLAHAVDRDPAWVSRTLKGPGNWTLRTAGELIQALNGEVEILVLGLEDSTRDNYNAYDGYCNSNQIFNGDIKLAQTANSKQQIQIPVNNETTRAFVLRQVPVYIAKT